MKTPIYGTTRQTPGAFHVAFSASLSSCRKSEPTFAPDKIGGCVGQIFCYKALQEKMNFQIILILTVLKLYMPNSGFNL